MKNRTIIGKVSATEKCPSTIDEFYFWTDKKQILSPFDIIKVEHEHSSITYGVIEEINHVTDALSHFTSYISSDFGDTGANIGNMNRLGMNYVKARVICNTENIYTPVLDSRQVSLCNEDDVRTALGLTENEVKNPLVCGYLEMYKGENAIKVKVILNSHFLIGPDGAHINVSGISGLAAKTSYSMFLLNAIQQKFRLDSGETAAFVLFNVKGRDLMAIDEPNIELSDKDKKIYSDLGLEVEPFHNVRYYYPYGKGGHLQSYAAPEDIASQKSRHIAFPYKFSFEQSLDMLDLLLANEDDSTGTLESCVNFIINGGGEFSGVSKWKTLIEKIDNCTKTSNAGGQKNEIQVASWRKFKRCVSKAINNDIFANTVTSGEVELSQEIANNLRSGEVMVIDIARLDENSQSFVFGSVARAIYDLKLGASRDDIPDKVIIFVDELNKYASTDVPKGSPILKQILDIAERGRSLGIILFSVEQFRSAIHDRVKGNCATSAYGRTNAIEVSKPDYRYIPKAYQNMLTRLSPGEYIISNPALRSLVNIRFPRPLYKQFPNG
ncbi:ATP-binding protein [Muribaculaceae bacterium Isolate-113 (HZI)]|mgnify:FL=1|nr:ATP-binding protein [Muribaculaceae bacterium]ROS80991.1 ATP-binding protein [Muribaculaceae bacterium Isolate-036 (Harlan)]ROT17612.1 ATP-binding protein [Muribaculaceae bacterium Isolate-114 (HZI)]ROT21025.1 ATP-binding protein [Muribaculaceae bacterium Isolate-113 (HZI)]RXE67669.1 ATP-binding protein [Muribaculaceae bacterium Isolate-001 (NCI)]